MYKCMFIILTRSILKQQMSTCMKLFSNLKRQSFYILPSMYMYLEFCKKKITLNFNIYQVH